MHNNQHKIQSEEKTCIFSKLIKYNETGWGKINPKSTGHSHNNPEKPDDLWILFNLIANGDVISAGTTRKIQFSSDLTNKKGNSRVNLKLEIKVAHVNYDKDSSIIRLGGKTITANEFVKPGIFHTLELEIKKEFNLKKKLWDEKTIKVLKDGSAHQNSKYDIGIILMKDRSAEILLINKNASNTTTHCATIRREKTSNFEKFFDSLFLAFRKNIDMDVIPYMIIASNDSIKDDFRAYILLEAQRWKINSMESNKSRILTVNKGNVKDILSDKVVMNVMKSTAKSEINTRVFEEFMNMTLTKCDRVCYGIKSVEYAHELLAIETLLITQEILENSNIKLRKKYSALKKSVQEAGGKVVHFNEVEGHRLAQITGVAAILRFPIPNIDDLVL